MMAVRYHGCTCHQRYSALQSRAAVNDSNGNAKDALANYETGAMAKADTDDEEDIGDEKEDTKPQPGYFHVVASFILIVHGFTFLVPPDADTEDTDMMRTVGRWFGFHWDWMRFFTPYFQGLASVFNISLGIVSWWTSKESDRYNRLIQLRVFAFCINILHAYITGPIIYQNDETPLLAPGRIIGLFRLSYLTPGLMAAGVTEVIVEREQEQEQTKKEEETKRVKLGQKKQLTDQSSASDKGKSKGKDKHHDNLDKKSK